MKKTLFFAVGLFIALSSGSCEKDDYAPSTKRLLPYKIVASWGNANPSNPIYTQTTWEFRYDSQNRISELTNNYVYNGEPYGETTVSLFSYEGDNITITKNNVVWNYLRKGSVIEVTNNGTPQIHTIEIDNKLRSTSYSYAAQGNIEHDGEKSLNYDKENGVFRHVNMPMWYLTHVLGSNLGRHNLYNNCIEALKDGSGYGYSMEYNEYDYPIEIQQFPIELIGGGTESYTIEYIKAK